LESLPLLKKEINMELTGFFISAERHEETFKEWELI
jgi:hypothetical protein